MSETPLRDQLEQACSLMLEAHTAETVATADPLHDVIVRRLPATLRAIIANDHAFKAQRSAGQAT